MIFGRRHGTRLLFNILFSETYHLMNALKHQKGARPRSRLFVTMTMRTTVTTINRSHGNQLCTKRYSNYWNGRYQSVTSRDKKHPNQMQNIPGSGRFGKLIHPHNSALERPCEIFQFYLLFSVLSFLVFLFYHQRYCFLRNVRNR